MGDSKNKKEVKREPIDLDTRARIMLAATADTDESDNARTSKDENLTNEQVKDYLADVLEEIKHAKTKNQNNKNNQKKQG